MQELQADLRAAVLLLLVARCKGSPAALSAAGGVHAFLAMLKDGDVRIRYIAATFLQVFSTVLHLFHQRQANLAFHVFAYMQCYALT